MVDVSVIIPYFNKTDTIDRSVASVINQTYKSWEIIIIDDCSELQLVQKEDWNDLPEFCSKSDKTKSKLMQEYYQARYRYYHQFSNGTLDGIRPGLIQKTKAILLKKYFVLQLRRFKK